MRPPVHHLRAHRRDSSDGGQALGGSAAVRPGQADRRIAGGDQEPPGDRRRSSRQSPARSRTSSARTAPSRPPSRSVLSVLERLRVLDEVAYLRFASVYKGFEGVDDFRREVGLSPRRRRPKQRAASSMAELVLRRTGAGAGHLRPSRRSGCLLRGHPGRAGPRPAARCTVLLCTDGGKGSSDPSVDPARAGPPAGGRGGRGRRPCSGWSARSGSTTPTVSCPTTPSCARRWWPPSGGSDPRWCSAPTPPPSSSDRSTSTTGTTGSSDGPHSTPWRRPRRSRTTFPMPDRPTRCRPCC